MPMKIKESKREPVVVEKDGSKFYFRLGYRDILKIQDEHTRRGELQVNSYYHAVFEKALYKWDNVLDEKGKEAKYDEKLREEIVFGDNRIFSDQEMLDTVLKVVGKSNNGSEGGPGSKN